jgi:hypothetical protein
MKTEAKTDDKNAMFDLAKKQAAETGALLKKQAKARAEAKEEEKAGLPANQAHECAVLADKQKTERAEKKLATMPSFHGLQQREAVAALHEELTAMAGEHHIEVGPLSVFSLAFSVFDPVTGTVLTPARAHRRDTGEEEMLMTAEQVINDIISSRRHAEVKVA